MIPYVSICRVGVGVLRISVGLSEARLEPFGRHGVKRVGLQIFSSGSPQLDVCSEENGA